MKKNEKIMELINDLMRVVSEHSVTDWKYEVSLYEFEDITKEEIVNEIQALEYQSEKIRNEIRELLNNEDEHKKLRNLPFVISVNECMNYLEDNNFTNIELLEFNRSENYCRFSAIDEDDSSDKKEGTHCEVEFEMTDLDKLGVYVKHDGGEFVVLSILNPND